MADCRIMRSTRETAPNVPPMSLAVSAAPDARALARLKRSTARSAKPIAFSTSALRALESAIALRVIAAWWVVPWSRRVRISLTTVSRVSTTAPAEGQRAEPGVQEIDEDEIERHPGQVEQRARPLAAEEAAHRVDVAPALQRLGGRKAEPRHVDRRPGAPAARSFGRAGPRSAPAPATGSRRTCPGTDRARLPAPRAPPASGRCPRSAPGHRSAACRRSRSAPGC